MLSYQHGYHAGNFADVIKHIALVQLLNYLIAKDKPLFYLDTHSGKGLYDLKDKQAEKNKEYQQGIELIWNNKQFLPPVFQNYLNCINHLNPTGTLRHYPGSPFLAMHILRMQDRMYFCELHPREFAVLKQLPQLNKKIHFSNTDGLKAIHALLPPFEKRGLIFIDPSFEIKEEYKQIPLVIKNAYDRFSTGTFCLWYPLVNNRLTDTLNRGMRAINTEKKVRLEFNFTPTAKEGMTGCGLWIINPPYTFAEEMKTVLLNLKSFFGKDISSYTIERGE